MADRTFGWVQEAYKIDNLKKVVSLFVLDSEMNRILRFDKIPRLISLENGRDEFIKELGSVDIEIAYAHLVGKGIPAGDYTRATSPCSGIVQAALPGQQREYQGNWPADSFLRWAISIGFLIYNRENDTCKISDTGRAYANTEEGSTEERERLTKALLSYPPVCRILSLLNKNNHMTKFELGAQLGFVGEAGFTSIPQHMIIQGLSEAHSANERTKLLQNVEGTSDKYVRTISSWLKQMGWIKQVPKNVTIKISGTEYSDLIGQAYQLTLTGKTVLKYSSGISKFPKIPKLVMWDMLATKVSGREYLRNRRTYIIKYLQTGYRTEAEIVLHLKTKGMLESIEAISDDLEGLTNIGLNINRQELRYKVMDEIEGLNIPQSLNMFMVKKSETAHLKDRLRKYLLHINHRYLLLLDLAFDGNSDRDFEIETAELLTTELNFEGGRLGDTRKPDVCIFYKDTGVIIDNKAYSKGYPLPIKQADEMYRYVEENITRDKSINHNEWWKIFDEQVKIFYFAFISGSFTGGFKDRLDNISKRSGLRGAAISSINLLLMAEEIKSGRLSYEDGLKLFDCNDEIGIENFQGLNAEKLFDWDRIGNEAAEKYGEYID